MNQKKILLRFDDICPTMSWDLWNLALTMMDNNISMSQVFLAVIPDCKDPALQIDKPREDFWEYMRGLKNRGCTIAMHGYNHTFEIIADGIITKNKISEFAGLPYNVQYQKIKEGKEILMSHGIETDIFVAPAHSYDKNTLRALAANGFKYISDGFSNKPYVRFGIKCLPCRTNSIPRIKKNGYYSAIIHVHEWSIPGKENGLSQFRDFMANNCKDIVAFDEFKEWKSGVLLREIFIEWLFLQVRPVWIGIRKSLIRMKKK